MQKKNICVTDIFCSVFEKLLIIKLLLLYTENTKIFFHCKTVEDGNICSSL